MENLMQRVNSLLAKVLVFAIFFLCTWNASKIPFYMAFDAEGDTPYEKGGLEGSINLSNWIHGFHSTKLRAPACNFLLLHVAAGITVLVMMALSVIKKEWRRKYAVPFFCFSIFLGAHTLPAALLMDDWFTFILFTATCLWVIASAICGFFTLRNYDKDPVKGDKELAWEYGLITLGAFGAGFAESFGIHAKYMFYKTEGYWEVFNNDEPHEVWGKTVLYSVLPERFGMTVFLVWVAAVWFAWPLVLLKIDSNPTPQPRYTEIP